MLWWNPLQYHDQWSIQNSKEYLWGIYFPYWNKTLSFLFDLRRVLFLMRDRKSTPMSEAEQEEKRWWTSRCVGKDKGFVFVTQRTKFSDYHISSSIKRLCSDDQHTWMTQFGQDKW
jgi:hypothetical protein